MIGLKFSLLSIVSLLTVVIEASSDDDTVYCNSTIGACPDDKPCCSQYGVCGSGVYCLGGCNPRYSYNLSACMPMPICKDSQTVFNNYSSQVKNQYTYLGDAEANDWIYEGTIADYDDENALLLTMPQYSDGAVLSSTRYMWYGKVSARMKSSHLGGVVTAFIMFSSVQDEIDYEFIGDNLTNVQTNYYFEGDLNWTHSSNISTSDTFDNYHVYEIDWKEDHLDWIVDGKIGRTLYKNHTYNSSTGQYDYPQTPARVQLSIWPGGLNTSSYWTKLWAGGEINWTAPDIEDPGYYYATVQSVNITCYDPPSGTKQNGSRAYRYVNSKNFTQAGVAITNDTTVMGSLDDSGFNPENGKSSSSSSSSSSTSSRSFTTQSRASKSSSKGSSETSAQSGQTTGTSSSSQQTGFVQNMKSTSASAGGSSSSSGGAGSLDINANGLMHAFVVIAGAVLALV
ncbi:LAME_0D05072g1_1 [Lachancea meyersii CBS 8951]|uniref:Crh-like protein n=1 Tax=Lachancea meyersii CBS 8951 TaxID=1266667 RepID=A0A1G4J8F4_9SACH|nr:LAME_0D05072g1_1 [Lachancea meyersii CBS 8951]